MAADPRSVVTAYVAAFNRGDLDALVALFAPDALVYGVLGFGGVDVARPIWRDLMQCLGMQLTIEAMAVDGDDVAVRYTERGRALREFRGIPASGRRYEIVAMEWFVVRDGLIQRRWGARDSATITRQLTTDPA
jgi:steroid delta-isomerase-like uncharacterized protein